VNTDLREIVSALFANNINRDRISRFRSGLALFRKPLDPRGKSGQALRPN
jgi:hypothetical protein